LEINIYRYYLFNYQLIKIKPMKQNVGKVDMIIRIAIALIIGIVGITYQSWWGLIAILPLFTAFFKFCPLYTLIGCNTCSAEKVE